MADAETNPTGTEGLTPELAALREQAQAAARHAYAPYSCFRVGAALRLTDGAVVTGVNVENASYGLTLCAERAALVQAVSRFGPRVRVIAAAIANLNQAASPPCGACRQVLAEFMDAAAPVVFPAADGVRVMALGDVLPLAFGGMPAKGGARNDEEPK